MPNSIVQSPWMGVMAVLLASFLWGTTGTAATFAPDVSPLAIGAVAMGFGGLLQAMIAIKPLKTHRATLYQYRWLVLFGGLNILLYPLAFYSSMFLSGVAIGTVVSIGLAPLAAIIIERTIDGRRLSGLKSLSLLLGLIGLMLLTQSKSPSVTAQQTTFTNLLGIGLGVVAAITYAFYSWVAHRLINRNIASSAAMGSIFGIGGVMLMPVLLLTGSPLLDSWNNAGVGIYMALIPMFIGYVLFGFGLNFVAASTATTITLLEPVVAAILAVIVVGETLTQTGWLGIGLICACLLLASLPASRSTEPAAVT